MKLFQDIYLFNYDKLSPIYKQICMILFINYIFPTFHMVNINQSINSIIILMGTILEDLMIVKNLIYHYFTKISISFLMNSKRYLQDIFSRQVYLDSRQDFMVDKLLFSKIFILKGLELFLAIQFIIANQVFNHQHQMYFCIFAIKDHKLDWVGKFQLFILIFRETIQIIIIINFIMEFFDITYHQSCKMVFQRGIYHKILNLR